MNPSKHCPVCEKGTWDYDIFIGADTFCGDCGHLLKLKLLSLGWKPWGGKQMTVGMYKRAIALAKKEQKIKGEMPADPDNLRLLGMGGEHQLYCDRVHHWVYEGGKYHKEGRCTCGLPPPPPPAQGCLPLGNPSRRNVGDDLIAEYAGWKLKYYEEGGHNLFSLWLEDPAGNNVWQSDDFEFIKSLFDDGWVSRRDQKGSIEYIKQFIPRGRKNPLALSAGDTLVVLPDKGKTLSSSHDGGASRVVEHADILRDNPCGTMSNPSTSKRTLLARQMDAVYTDQGMLDFGRCPAYGLEDGSVFVKAGDRGPAPAGLIMKVVYIDTSKARLVRKVDSTCKEKLTTPWIHDFSKTTARVYKVKGGYLLKGNMPLWENKEYSA